MLPVSAGCSDPCTPAMAWSSHLLREACPSCWGLAGDAGPGALAELSLWAVGSQQPLSTRDWAWVTHTKLRLHTQPPSCASLSGQGEVFDPAAHGVVCVPPRGGTWPWPMKCLCLSVLVLVPRSSRTTGSNPHAEQRHTPKPGVLDSTLGVLYSSFWLYLHIFWAKLSFPKLLELFLGLLSLSRWCAVLSHQS